MTIKRALISVSDKTGLVEFAKQLHAHHIQIIASGGTAKILQQAHIPVTEVEVFTGSPEILGGRVKTLHPRIHAGILADRNNQEHMRELEQHQFLSIDLVVCNLYPFEQTVKEGASKAEVIEDIDIGGPTLVRAAAKNCDGGVTVVVDPNDYQAIAEKLPHVSIEQRQQLASKAFQRIADYDVAIASWFNQTTFPQHIGNFQKQTSLRYGENPHQQAFLYTDTQQPSGVAHGIALQGKELSYNNYLDSDAAYRAVYTLENNACAIIKHTNPCGIAIAEDQSEAFKQALEGDKTSAFGGIIGFNQVVSQTTAQTILDTKLFVECIVAPGFSDEAKQLFKAKENLRLLQVPKGEAKPKLSLHALGGGLLLQQTDDGVSSLENWQVVTEKQLEDGWLKELEFAMHVAFILKSNAITVTKNLSLKGFGAGQTSRIDAAMQAIQKAGEQSRGAFMGSDAFFPFADCVELAQKAGIVAIVQPGGSKRDQESIDACNQAGIAMVFTGKRHFRH